MHLNVQVTPISDKTLELARAKRDPVLVAVLE
jgi:hypothetical protein